MKRYEDKQVVTRSVCVELICDMCGRKAEMPEDGLWTWGGVGSASGKLEWHYAIDGDYEAQSFDLCFDCAEKVTAEVQRARRCVGYQVVK
jgi:hypothetical protein